MFQSHTLVAIVLLLSPVLSLAVGAHAGVAVSALRCEYKTNPIGIDPPKPRLSWNLSSDRRGETQTAYQVLVATTPELLNADKGDLWDSGKVAGDQTLGVEYGGAGLRSGVLCHWKVKIWDRDGQASAFSEAAVWEMGLLDPADWKAEWIQSPAAAEPEPPSSAKGKGNEWKKIVGPLFTTTPPYLRKPFDVSKPVARARLYATALGVYECSINGRRAGDAVLAPDWTDYHKRVRYQTYDVTSLVRQGGNVLGAVLADGWYSGHVAFKDQVYGLHPAFRAQLVVQYADGSTDTVATDGTWKTADGPILGSDFLSGEEYDAQREMPGWDATGFDDASWKTVKLLTSANPPLEAQIGPPVRKLRELPVKSVSEPAPGKLTFDLGQNMVGFVRLKISGEAGTKVTLRFAEMLNPDGTVYTTNLRAARATDVYTLKGGGEETWEPRFTFHGFRYVEVSGHASKLDAGAITGVVIGSDTPQTGAWECSSPLLNQLQSNIVWGQRGNYLSVPTDCPQRNERLGWMGDAQVFVRTAAWNADVAAFFDSWMVDVSDAQRSDGAYSDVSPNIGLGMGVAAWADAGVICPWTIAHVYGDRRLVERQYASMAKFIDFLKVQSAGLIRPAEGYGDWLSIHADTPKDVLATAYFAYSTHLMARMAKDLGKEEDAQKYQALFEDIRKVFNTAFVAPDGRIKGNTQTSYLLALQFELLDESKRKAAAQYLVDDIKEKDWHLSTGFVGVSYLLPVLTRYGHVDVAYRLLNQDTFPSWLFSVKHGATTIWERWDGWTPEKGFQDAGMNSFNHYSLGSCGEWMYETVAGIGSDPDHPAFKHVVIRPRPGGGLTAAKATFDSIRGRISTEWKLDGGAMSLNVAIPANATATVYVPAADGSKVSEGSKPAESAEGVKFLRAEDGAAVYEVGSGTYAFRSSAVATPGEERP